MGRSIQSQWLVSPARPSSVFERASCREERGLLASESCPWPGRRGAALVKDLVKVGGGDVDPIVVSLLLVVDKASQARINAGADEHDTKGSTGVQGA